MDYRCTLVGRRGVPALWRHGSACERSVNSSRSPAPNFSAVRGRGGARAPRGTDVVGELVVAARQVAVSIQQQVPPIVVSGERLWSVQELGTYLGVEVRTLYHWRQTGAGPVAIKVGRALRYDPALVRQWLAERVL